MENLPNARIGVMQIHRSFKVNSNELQATCSILDSLKEEFCREREKLNDLKKDIARVERKTFLLLDDIVIEEKICETMKKEIYRQTNENASEELVMSKLIRNMEQEKRKMKEYETKMADSRLSNSVYEEQCEGSSDIPQLVTRLSDLQYRKSVIQSNIERCRAQQTHTQDEVVTVGRGLNSALQDLSHTSSMLADARAQVRGKTQRITVLKKRNEAQLTRLQRQVTEYNKHNAQ